jgi:branched-chain amino acid transport system permease protein
VRRYAREQSVHLAVMALLAAYPVFYHVLVVVVPEALPAGQPTTLTHEAMIAVLPRVETMVAVLYFGLFAMSFDFISGYTGYLSFGHAAFYGTGAYTVILVANGKLSLSLLGVTLLGPGTPFMLSLLVAGLIAALLAVLIGSVSFRLSGVYFAMVTLGFAQVLYVFVRDWEFAAASPRDGPSVSFDAHPNGFEVGVPGFDPLNLQIGLLTGEEVAVFGHTLGTEAVSFYMIGLVVAVCYFAMQRIVHSPFGRVMVAIRENEERTEAVGYEPFWYKLTAFAISGFFAGVAGGLFAGFRRSATPDNAFFFLVTGDALLVSIIGGFGTLAGPLYGRLFDEAVREFLTKADGGLLPFLRALLPENVLQTVIYNGLTVQEGIETFLNGHAPLYLGLLFVLFVLYVPNGLLGTVRDRLGGTVAKRVPAIVTRRIRRYRR